MKKKELYEAPLVEVFEVVHPTRVIMTSDTKRGTAGQDDTVNDYGDTLL